MSETAEQEQLSTPPAQRSHGTGRLSVVHLDGQTRIKTLYQQGCAKLRVPAQHRAGPLEAVMINTSGGMTGGDHLDWSFETGPGAALTVGAQACEKIYKSAGGTAATDIAIKAGSDSRIAWLPQETILFDNSAFQRNISADLDDSAELLMVEAMILGRQSMGEVCRSGSIRDRWHIRRNGRMVHTEAFSLSGNIDEIIPQKAVTGGSHAFATILLVSPSAERYLGTVREQIGKDGGASCWNGKLLARIVAKDGYQLRKRLVPVIDLLNPHAAMPKVWAL